MSDRTPKTNTVRSCFAKGHDFPETTDPDERYAEFDRWLAKRDADIAKRAINRMYELLLHKGEYNDIYGLEYIAQLVEQEARAEIIIVVKDAQVYGQALIKGENE